MARKLASAVALIAMAVSATALALGLGDISTRSALNQPFVADVALLSVDPTELDGVRVRLASAEAFQRAGVDRPFFLSNLKFTPQLNAAGKPVIHITSDQPIREPFLNFLVEVNWPKGKLVREYTVLLDPPTTLSRQPGAVARPQQAAPAMPAPAPAAPSMAAQPGVVMPDEYGPVKDNETLWGIARQLRPDGASLAQTLMALYKANPNAFVRGDINRLKRGRILRVPGHDEVFALSRREAQAAYRAEQDASMASRTQPPASAASEPSGEAMPEAGGDAGTAAAPQAEKPAGELRIATPRPEGQGQAGAGDEATAGTTSEDLKNALLLAREDAETARQAADNLQGEVQDLQQQLADMQKVISLQSEQLARLQAGATEQAAAPQEGAPEPGTEAAAEAGTEAGTEAAAEQGVEPAAPETEPEAPQAETPMTAESGESAAPEAAPTAEPEAAAPAAEPQAPAEPEPAAEPQRRPGMMDQLLGNPMLLGGAGGAVILLLLLLLILRRRKSAAPQQAAAPAAAAATPEEEADESILLEPGAGDELDLGPEEAGPAGNDTSFLSEFSPSEMHSLADETSEVDPVSEADVYIAYGRYDQAENLLDQALSREPERMALKFKLLEVYYANRNAAAFTACAQELADAGQDGVDTEAWQRVCDMGRDLAPDYPLFAGTAPAATEDSLPDFEPSQPASIEPLSEFGEESILEIPGAEESKRAGGTGAEPVSEIAPESTSETDMDLTLDLDDLSMPHSVAQDEESLEGLESIELELPDLDKDPTRKAAPAQGGDDSLILDLDTGLEDSVVGQPEEADEEGLDAESLQAQLEELSDLTEVDSELSQLTADFEALNRPEAESAAEQGAGEEPAEVDIPSPFAEEMADEDEVQTKLDLAIAYVEMGDKEGARSILDEVRAEGSDAQKARAEQLLADIES